MVRYIGKTTNMLRRLSSHISEAKSKPGKRYVLNWINSLLDKGLLPVMDLVEECTEDNWEEKEKYWIKHFRQENPKLCNQCDGGLGGTGEKNWTKEELKRRANQMSKQMSKFTDSEKRDIWRLLQEKKTLEEISNIYPLFDRNNYFQVSTGRVWNNITKLPKVYKVRQSLAYKLSDEDIVEIRKLYNSKEKTQKELIEIYGISSGYMSDICKGKKRN
jgi:hypothetical protein